MTGTAFDGTGDPEYPEGEEYPPDSAGVLYEWFQPSAINNKGWAIQPYEYLSDRSFNYNRGSYWDASQKKLYALDGQPSAINDDNDILVGGDAPFLIEKGNNQSKKYLRAHDPDLGMLPPKAQPHLRKIAPTLMSNRVPPPTDGSVIPMLHIVFTAEIERSPATWQASTFLLRLFSDETTDLHEMTYPDGVTNLRLQSINSSGVIAAIGDPDGDTGPTAVYHALLLVPYEIKAASIPYLEKGDTTKPLPKSGSVGNLLSVWSDGAKGTELTIRLVIPDDFKSIPNFVTWKSDDYTTLIPPNTTEWMFNWLGKFGRKKITIEFTLANLRRLVYVDVPNVGTKSEARAKWEIIWQGGDIFWFDSLEAGRWSESFANLSAAKKNALKHAYWCALGASDDRVGKSVTLDYGSAHEYSGKIKDQQSVHVYLGGYNSTMDLFNNVVGANTIFNRYDLELGENRPNESKIQAALLQKLNNGELMIWDGTGNWSSDTSNRFLIRSNGDKYYPTEEKIHE